jgi:hypothetical protein
MKQSILLAAGIVVLAGIAQAQSVNFANIATAQVGGYGSWSPSALTQTASGLQIVATGYGGAYVDISDYQGAVNINPNATQVALLLTVTGTAPLTQYAWNGTGFMMNDSLASSGTWMPNPGGAGNNYSGPGNGGDPANMVWVQDSATSWTLTETATFKAADVTAIQGGGAYVYGLNLNFDPSGDETDPYNVTINALTFSPVPEPTTLALGGLSAISLLAFRKRK